MISEAQKENILRVARLALDELRGAEFHVRRRAVMTVPIVLGHRIGVEDLQDQPWGVVGQCANCGQIAKAPREGDTIEGRAVSTVCPAFTPKKDAP